MYDCIRWFKCKLKPPKNWNSHGAIVGAALCQLGSVLGSLESGAIGPLINTEFQQVIPLGNALTGQKHGHSETVYVEYMVSDAEEVVASGEDCNYLNHATFCGTDMMTK